MKRQKRSPRLAKNKGAKKRMNNETDCYRFSEQPVYFFNNLIDFFEFNLYNSIR